MIKALMGGIVGGIILFMWSGFSWMVLPWHKDTLHHFKNEASVVKVMKVQAPESGIYVLPAEKPAAGKEAAAGPLVFAAVHQEGMSPMKQSLWIEFITQAIAAFLVTALLMHTSGMSYFKRVSFIVTFAFTAGIITHGMYWNWFKFPQDYTMVAMADLLIGWFLAGLVIAGIARGKKGYRA